MADAGDRLPHLFVVGRVDAQDLRRGGGGRKPVRKVDRAAHGQRLRAEASSAFNDAALARLDVGEAELRASGSIITVEGADSVHLLKLESLDRSNHWWLLLSVMRSAAGGEWALVWVSDSHRDKFLQIFDEYLQRDRASGKPHNEQLVANIGRIRTALLRDLWQSTGEPPAQGTHWWEVWLRREAGAEDLLRRFGESAGIQVAASRMEFDQRTVMWVRASWASLTILPATAVPIAEIRLGLFVDTVDDLDLADQQELVTDLADRLVMPPDGAPAVCLIDTGSRRTHALLQGSIDPTDWHSVTADHPGDIKGHGTLMAGLALLGPIDSLLLGSGSVELLHCLESVKILPDHGPGHDPPTYGLVTAQAVAMPETTKTRPRVLCMPITAPHERSTEPSLWSASIDALAAGTDIGLNEAGIALLGPPDPGAARLFVISAGNCAVQTPPPDYLDLCDTSVIEDPAQAWNALVVGAATDLVDLPTDPTYAGWVAMAAAGELSPHSRTGLLIPPKWPTRPDICMEGGNVLTNGVDLHGLHPVATLTTTGHRDDLAISWANATSAATAQASRLAARVMSTYPAYWPETVRGLLVHCAEWTAPMQARMGAAQNVKAKRAVLGRYGWGIPDEDSLLGSTRQAVTLVVQDQFVPFTGAAFTMRQFRLHNLPWPADVLAELGGTDVRLKVTLSYFIEPSAPRRGWRSRYAYASHGLRFELRNSTETTSDFVRRVNREAGAEEGGGVAPGSGVERWLVGPQARNDGSLHQDVWVGSGADLAQCGILAVHPVGGWWKNGKRHDRRDLPVRYSLIVSLATDAAGVDIYEPIALDLGVPIDAVVVEV